MTVAVCTNCGALKHGALCPCPACGSELLDTEINILLSDHNLDEEELARIGEAVRVIRSTGVPDEMRFHLLTYFLARKWPKLLEFDIEAVDPELQRSLDGLYRSKLSSLDGQIDPSLRVSRIRQLRWTKASTMEFQADEDVWQAEVQGLLRNGIGIARQIVTAKIQAGEGAVLQRLVHVVRTAFERVDYRKLAARAVMLIGDAGEHRRAVDEFCSRMKNGWSDRTKEQAAYFRGSCQRLEEMAERAKNMIEHKAGINSLIEMDFRRKRQEFRQSYKTFRDLSLVVLDPTRIMPDGSISGPQRHPVDDDARRR